MGDIRSRALFARAAKHSRYLLYEERVAILSEWDYNPFITYLLMVHSLPYLLLFNKSLKLLSFNPVTRSSGHVFVEC